MGQRHLHVGLYKGLKSKRTLGFGARGSLLGKGSTNLDERQITHLICARLKYDLYDFFRGVLGPFIQEKSRKQAQNSPKKVI